MLQNWEIFWIGAVTLAIGALLTLLGLFNSVGKLP